MGLLLLLLLKVLLAWTPSALAPPRHHFWGSPLPGPPQPPALHPVLPALEQKLGQAHQAPISSAHPPGQAAPGAATSPPAPRPVLEWGLPGGTHSHAGHPIPQPLATSCCWAGRGQHGLPPRPRRARRRCAGPSACGHQPMACLSRSLGARPGGGQTDRERKMTSVPNATREKTSGTSSCRKRK